MSIIMKIRPENGTTFTVAIAGDFCPRGRSQEVAEMAPSILEEILPEYQKADVRLLQWEVAITREDTPIIKSGPNLKCDPVALQFAKTLGAEVLLLANNHVGDYGPEVVMQTIAHAEKEGFLTVGAGKNAAEAAKPLILDVKGLSLAILNSCEHEFGLALRDTPGSAGTDLFDMMADVAKLKKEGHLVLSTLHGGHENYPFPSPRMVKWFRAIADFGADAVFNTHTHCPLGAEVYKNVPIVASCGNFYFPTATGEKHKCSNWHLGYIPIYHFDKDGVYQLEILPYLNLNKKVKRLTEEEEKHFEAYFAELCKPFTDEIYREELFESWCWNSKGPSNYFRWSFQEYPEEVVSEESRRRLMNPRNFIHCQSHNELLKTVYSMIEQLKTGTAGKWEEKILSLQYPDWLKVD